jgi:hypothetical protein
MNPSRILRPRSKSKRRIENICLIQLASRDQGESEKIPIARSELFLIIEIKSQPRERSNDEGRRRFRHANLAIPAIGWKKPGRKKKRVRTSEGACSCGTRNGISMASTGFGGGKNGDEIASDQE